MTQSDESKQAAIREMGHLHARLIFPRRVTSIAAALEKFIPQGASVLDIGCGNGEIASTVSQMRSDISITGLEVQLRPECAIEAAPFDGKVIPLPDASKDVCMLVDVLHHACNAEQLLLEAARVSRRWVLIKDHHCDNAFDRVTLRFMDWVGNRPYGVALNCRYFSRREWGHLFSISRLSIVSSLRTISLYPFPFSVLFGRHLHFVALAEKTSMSH